MKNPFSKKVLQIGLALIEQVVPAVKNVEVLAKALHDNGKTMTSAEKLAAAKEMVNQGILAAEDVAGKDLLHEGKVQDAIQHSIDATVDVLNAIQAAKQARQPDGTPAGVRDASGFVGGSSQG